MPIEKNPWAVRVRSPSGGASDGVFYVFVGRHGIETVSGAKLLLNLSGRRGHYRWLGRSARRRARVRFLFFLFDLAL